MADNSAGCSHTARRAWSVGVEVEEAQEHQAVACPSVQLQVRALPMSAHSYSHVQMKRSHILQSVEVVYLFGIVIPVGHDHFAALCRQDCELFCSV